MVLGEIAVACKRREVLHQAIDVILEMGPMWMARHLGLLPGVQFGVGVAQPLDIGDQRVSRRAGLILRSSMHRSTQIAHAAESASLLLYALRVSVGCWRSA